MRERGSDVKEQSFCAVCYSLSARMFLPQEQTREHIKDHQDSWKSTADHNHSTGIRVTVKPMT